MYVLPYLFGISCFIIFYNYIGYALLVYFYNSIKRAKSKVPNEPHAYFPTVTFIVAAYNEEDCIEKKIINSLQQDYPSDRMEYIFITDGSTDSTPDIVKNYPAITLMHEAERKGKCAAMNRAVQVAKNDIIIFSDANTVLNPNATQYIARQYKDKMVGGVAGEKKIIPLASGPDQVGASEGMYWKYESFLKKLDSEFYSVVGAAGELFSVRRDLFEHVSDDVILDDFIISLKVAQKGYRIMYEPMAYAMELPSFSLEDEKKRKIRIAAGGFQSIVILKDLLLFWKQPKLSFLYISHRVLRWTLSPLCLIIAFVTNGLLCLTVGGFMYYTLFFLQLVVYFQAAIASFLPAANNRFKLLKFSYYFVFMNISVFQGLWRFMKGTQTTRWEKSRRVQPLLDAEQYQQ